MPAIIDFYCGDAPDYLGRRLEDILAWNDVRLELVHNYIQVLFPLGEESLFNVQAPLLDDETIATFHTSELARNNLARAFERMLRFYGFRYEATSGLVGRGDNFALAILNWLNPFNHNYRRITRILKCLTALGLEESAQDFFACLREIYSEYGHEIGQETFSYWQAAAQQSPA